MKHKLAIDNVAFEGDLDHPSTLHSQVDVVTVNIWGLTCHAYAQSVETRLSQIKGVVDIKVSLEQNNAVIKYVGLEISSHQICQEIKKMGFDASLLDPAETSRQLTNDALLTFRLEGVTCQTCVSTIEGKIGKLHGVKRIKVALSSHEATIRYYPDVITPDELKKNMDSLGYDSTIKHKQAPLTCDWPGPEHLKQVKIGMPPVHRHEDDDRRAKESEVNRTSAVVLGVEGLHCKACVCTLERAVSALPGVQGIQVSLDKKNAIVWFDQSMITLSSLQQAIQALPPGNFEISFSREVEVPNGAILPNTTFSLPCFASDPLPVQLQAKSSTTVISIGGMTCASCVNSVESFISQRKGVEQVSVSLAKGTGIISYDSKTTNAEELRAVIEDMGYDASILTGIVLKPGVKEGL